MKIVRTLARFLESCKRMKKAFIGNVDKSCLHAKNVLVRVDYNVPLDINRDGAVVITSDARIQDSLETLLFLISAQAKIILISHLGRPSGVYNEKLSLKPIAHRLNDLLEGKAEVEFMNDCTGPAVQMKFRTMHPGQVVLLENLRFHKEEEFDNPYFASELALNMDFFVNDAFSASHKGKKA